MKRKYLVIATSIFVAGSLMSAPAFSQSKSKDKTIHPDLNESVGGSKSERDPETGTPLTKGSPSSGTVEKGAGQGGRQPTQTDRNTPSKRKSDSEIPNSDTTKGKTTD